MKTYFRILLPMLGALAMSPVIAQTAAPSEGQLEEIVITAQKRTEKLEDVPVSAAVVSSEALANENVSDIVDLNKLVPSVQLNGTINGRVPMGMRGISSVSNEQAVGVPSGVGVMVDGVPIPSDSYDGNDLEDIQSVEVLKGPQATLGGRTAAAGIINIVTRGPTDTLQGNATVTATNDHEQRFSGFVSGPLADRIQGSVSAFVAKRDYPITNVVSGQKTSEDDYGARGKLRFKITDDFDATVMAHYANTVTHGFNFVYTYMGPGAKLLGAIPQSEALPNITPSYQNLSIDSIQNVADFSHQERDFSLDLNWRLAGGYTLTSTTETQNEREHLVQDLFATDIWEWGTLFGGPPFTPAAANPPGLDDSQSQEIKVTQTSEELKLVSPTSDQFNYVLGAFYSDTKVDLIEKRRFPGGPPPGTPFYGVDCLLHGGAFCQRVTPDTATYDLYGRSTWKFASSTSLVTSLRYNYDALSYNWFQLTQSGLGPFTSSGKNNSSTVVGDISLQQQFQPDWMGYVTYARGYSPAVYDTGAVLASNATVQPVGKENIDHFEIGSKGTYFDQRLMVNVALFDTEYHHYQIEYYQNNGSLTPPLVLSGNGGARTRGLELDTAWQATNLLRVNVNLAYINAIFTQFTGASCWLGEPAPACAPSTILINGVATPGQPTQNLSGSTMPNSPKFKVNMGVEQRLPMANQPFEWVLGGHFSYRTSDEMLPDGNPHAIQGAFGILNLNAGIRGTGGKWSATAFVNNVANKIYYTDVEDFFSGAWGVNTIIGQPARDAHRYAGIRLSVGF
jgi:iron complex outermembrane recepter protein